MSGAETVFYAVDEAGDPVLFNRKKQVVVGREGCPRFFILGKLDVQDPADLRAKLEALRQSLLKDPYFKGVASFDPRNRKTAVAFHAKDDLPEVRYRVFDLLKAEGGRLRFYAVVRDKLSVVNEVRKRNAADSSYKYNLNELYDDLVRELFNKMHRISDKAEICFSKRGNKLRTKAMEEAIEKAEGDFEQNFGFPHKPAKNISHAEPRSEPVLQAVDYFLWAVQRFYETGEERFLEVVWPQIGEIYDIDVHPTKERRGAFYTKAKVLSLATRPGITKRMPRI